MEESKYRQFKFIVLFPLIILYFEIVFRIFTTGNFFSSSFFPMLFFSLAYGGIGYLLSSLHKNIKVNKWIAAALIFFTCLLYIVPVSYTHLDVYKRQHQPVSGDGRNDGRAVCGLRSLCDGEV